MAGEWIKIESCTPNKAEVLKLARLLKIDRDAALGKLVRLWVWIDQVSVDGVVDGVVAADVDRICSQDGFGDACRIVGWLVIDQEQERISLPHFDNHNGQTAKHRALKNQRQARWRSENVDVSVDKQETVRRLQKRLPEKRREESTETPIVPFELQPPSPPAAAKKKSVLNQDPLFDKFWADLLPANRIGKRKAWESWTKAVKAGSKPQEIIAGIPDYRKYEKQRREQKDYRPLHPATWLNQGRWEDSAIHDNGEPHEWIDKSIYG